jgi:predicted RNA-binding protein with PUA-like domain
MNYWLIKSEPDCYSIDDFKKDKRTSWSGVRNYQARNFMKEMRVGDMALFYHSSTDPKAVVGIAKVVKEAHPDTTALDKKDDHYDPKATKENPIWYMVDFAFVEKFKNPVTLAEVKRNPKLEGIPLTQPGSRLSVQPVSKAHFETIQKLGKE